MSGPSQSTASAPASSGNLGPGFDVVALALELRCCVEAAPADAWIIHQDGSSYEPGSDDIVRRAVEAAVDQPMELSIVNDIPRSRGLGSSSAVTTAAAAAAMRAVGVAPDSPGLFEIVAALEGHGDNAAAAVYGGLVVVSGAAWRRFEISPELTVIVGIPDARLRTSEARSVLSPEVSRWAAARNLGRLAFLLEGLRCGDPAVLEAAAGDELHEVPRQHLSPVTAELMEAARRGGALHAAWSGAGPTAIAFATADAVDSVAASMTQALDGQGTVRQLDVASQGWT
jgi:homoserine kinase